jgi:predicted Zn-dependent protease
LVAVFLALACSGALAMGPGNQVTTPIDNGVVRILFNPAASGGANGFFTGSGSIVANKNVGGQGWLFVLTADHVLAQRVGNQAGPNNPTKPNLGIAFGDAANKNGGSAYLPAQRVFRPNFNNGPRNVDIGLLAIPYKGAYNPNYSAWVTNLIPATAFIRFTDIGFGARTDLVANGYQVAAEYGTERYLDDMVRGFNSNFSFSGYRFDAVKWGVTGPNSPIAIAGTGAVAEGDSGSPLFSSQGVVDLKNELSYFTNDQFAVDSAITFPGGDTPDSFGSKPGDLEPFVDVNLQGGAVNIAVALNLQDIAWINQEINAFKGVPEPSTLVLAGIAGTIFAACRVTRRRGKTTSASRRWARGLALVGALSGAPAVQAGSILLTLELLEKHGSTTGMGESSQRFVELDQAAQGFKRGEFETALKQLGQVVKAHPDLPSAQVLFARLAFENNQTALIRPALERASAEAPADPEVYILFGNLALLEGRPTDAAVHFDKATALSSSQRWTGWQRESFERLCLQGRASVAEGRGDWKAAQTALEGWLKLEPAHAAARQRLGRALFNLGQPEAAYKELKRASEEDRTLEPAAITMGWLHLPTDPKKARGWMDYAIQADPNSHAVRIGVAAWLLEQGRLDEVQTHAEVALRLDPKSTNARRLLGLVARARKDLAGAEPIFAALGQEAPGDAWVRSQWALVLAEQADEAKQRKALELAESIARQNPNDPDAIAALGTVYYRRQRLDEAEKLLQAVLDSGHGSSDTAYMLARIKADRGQPAGARDLLQAALAAPGLFVFRDEARQWLDRLAGASRPRS